MKKNIVFGLIRSGVKVVRYVLFYAQWIFSS